MPSALPRFRSSAFTAAAASSGDCLGLELLFPFLLRHVVGEPLGHGLLGHGLLGAASASTAAAQRCPWFLEMLVRPIAPGRSLLFVLRELPRWRGP